MEALNTILKAVQDELPFEDIKRMCAPPTRKVPKLSKDEKRPTESDCIIKALVLGHCNNVLEGLAGEMQTRQRLSELIANAHSIIEQIKKDDERVIDEDSLNDKVGAA